MKRIQTNESPRRSGTQRAADLRPCRGVPIAAPAWAGRAILSFLCAAALAGAGSLRASAATSGLLDLSFDPDSLALIMGVRTAVAADPSPACAPARSEPIPMAQIGAVAGKQYQGEGLSVAATPQGARLRCVFQKLEGEATREGLWLSSTITNATNDRFRIVATAVGRQEGGRASLQAQTSSGKAWESGPVGMLALPGTGTVEVADQVVRFTRPGLLEEYSVSMDGVRQDFLVRERPAGGGELALRLAVSGAKVQPAPFGARLVLDHSGRKIAYSRLRVTDATGKELCARIEVLPGGDEVASLNSSVESKKQKAELNQSLLTSALCNSAMEDGAAATGARLAMVVNDAEAVYPIRIDPTFSDANWVSMNPQIPGANGIIRAAAVDGSGNLYIGGSFTVVGDVLATNIAKWNGSSWSALSSGMNSIVYALAVSGSDVYAGGQFTKAGGTNANYVAKWNGSSWSALGLGMNNSVNALAVSGSDLYVGGDFTSAGGAAANRIAKWNESSWSALGSGMNSRVEALAASGGDLYAGGGFTSAGGAAANYIAKWDGSTWSALGSGMNSTVYALVVSGSDLYAGGPFTTAGGSPAHRMAKWDGGSWSALGSGMDNTVSALAVSGSDLYAGGNFTTAGGSAANRIARWNGSSWSALGVGVNSPVYALAASGSDLYAGGYFTTAGGSGANYIAKWDGNVWNGGSKWEALGSGLGGSVHAVAVSGSNVYAGGEFTAAGGAAANYIAKWDGSTWSALGSGMNNYVRALVVIGSDLYAGGEFTTAGGSAASYIAKWDGSSWSALGSGVSGWVNALAVSGTDLYAGGDFTTAGGSAASRIAKWNGSSWSALGVGVNSPVYALAASGSDLYAGGWFTTAGGSAANRIARWNGSSWSALGSGMNNGVLALAVSGSDLYAGGYFTTAGGVAANRIARWDGSSWSPLGSGMSGTVRALAVSGRNLCAGGQFTTAGGVVTNNIAKWDGSSWSALGSGMNSYGYVFALATSGNDLYAGGSFTTAGSTDARYIAKSSGGMWRVLAPAPIAGVNGLVHALALLGSNVYVGGRFTTAGGVAVNNIAKWDGSRWSALGSGMNRNVYALAASGTNLYVGGDFTKAGGSTANCIAKWNGSGWSALGSGVNSTVYALAVAGSDLYAGGNFTWASNSTYSAVSANRIARWNGSWWYAPGSGVNSNVYALAVSGSDVYAGGDFTTAGGYSANHIAAYSGGSYWYALGSGMNSNVYALAVAGSDVYAGGSFTKAGGYSAPYIAKWNGSYWSALGSGMDNPVYALAVSGSNVYAGGNFLRVSNTVYSVVGATRLAKWNGSGWSALGSGVNSSVLALAVSGSDVYAGGAFYPAVGSDADHITKWNGSNWSALAEAVAESGINYFVLAVAVSGSNVYAGGSFTTAGGSAGNYIAKWDGSSWSSLGLGMNNVVYALAVSGSDLYAGGSFTTAGGSAANRIARWTGSSWSALGPGMSGTVRALAVAGSDLYAGGDFTTAGGSPANRVAKWNGSSWSALGSGIGGDSDSVSALAVSGGDLYAGGYFTSAGGAAANYIAKWNGSTWMALGSGIGGAVEALAVSGADLYAGGRFTTAGGSPANCIAKWDGSNWSALGSGMGDVNYPPRPYVYELVVSGGDLYAGGRFTTAGGGAANYIAKWDGSSWSALGSGLNDYVYALAASGGDLYVGGQFTMAGGKRSAYVAKARLGTPPYITQQPIQVNQGYVGGTVTFTVAAGGTEPLAYQWMFGGTNAIPAATNANLVLTGLQVSDSGSYSCIITNVFGSVTSSHVVLTVLAYRTAVLADHPSVYWRLGEGNGRPPAAAGPGAVAVDYVGGYNGSYTPNVQIGVAGYHVLDSDTAASFGRLAGPTSYVNCASWPDLSQQGSNAAFSVEAWVCADRQTADNGIVTVGFGAGGEQFDLDANGGYGSRTWRFFVRDSSGAAHVITSRNGPDGNWHHLAGVCDQASGILKLYLDGALEGTAALQPGSGILTSNTPLTIGARKYNGASASPDLQFVGKIDEVALYRYALSPAQVLAHYEAGAIALQPRSQVVTAGLAASIALAGVPAGQALSYQWRFNGTNLPGASGSTLTLSNVQTAHAGVYQTVLTHPSGSATTLLARLSVVAPLTNGAGFAIPPAGMVNWWAGEGNADDLLAANNGTPENGLSYVQGKVGLAFRFDGSWARIYLGATSLPPPWTACFWVNRQDTPATSAGLMGDGHTGLKLEQYKGTHQVGISAFSGTNYGDYTFGYTVPVGTWTHLVFVGTTANVTLHVNGSPQRSLAVRNFPLGRGFIGADMSGAYDRLLGSLDEIMVFNRALSQSEVASIYAAGNAGRYIGPVAPVITAHPQAQTVAAGSNAVFTVSAVGTPTIRYQWQFNGGNILGATNASLVLTNLAVTAAGNYRCLASNTFGSVGSSNALLTVTRQPLRFDSSGGVTTSTNRGVQLRLLGLAGAGPVVIYASTNLVLWEAIFTNAPVVGSSVFLDLMATNYPRRFYRAAEVLAATTVTLNNLWQIYDGRAKSVSYTTTPPGLLVDLTYNGSPAAPTNAGSYTVIGAINDPTYQGAVTNTLVIFKATASVTFGNLLQAYDGTAKPVSVTTTPPGVGVSVTYNGSPSAPTNAGNYTVAGTINDPNYQGSATNTLVVMSRVAFFSLDTDPGWLCEGEWAFGKPAGLGGTNHGYPDPAVGASGSNVFGINLNGDYSTNVGAPHYLTAGPLQFSGWTGMKLRFRRWLNTDYQPYVFATIDISTNGSVWTQIWTNGSSQITDAVWSVVVHDVSSHADNRANVYVRWGHQVGFTGAYACSGWNIDDIEFHGIPKGTPPLLTNPSRLGDGRFQFSFTGSPGLSYGVLCATNLSVSLSNWTLLGPATETSPGQFQFTDPAAMSSPVRYYRVRCP